RDFAVNRLGTCKHIEAVLHRIRKHPDYDALVRRQVPQSFVYLHWGDGPSIRLHRGADLDATLAQRLSRWFDTDGRFVARLPEDFFALCNHLGGRDDLDIGEDARQYALRLANQAAHRRRYDGIRQAIEGSAGVLPGVKARLYPYQVEGVAFLAGNGRAMLADDMGLGKTLQAIAAATWLRNNDSVGRTLIVCPASLKHQWAQEIGRFSDASVQIVQGGLQERTVQYRREADFHIINYELVLRDLSVIKRLLAPDLLILDEAQRIKNWRTKTAAAIKDIDTAYAFVLSGTPLENRLEDLYSLMQVIDDQILGPLWKYLIDFHVTDDKGKVLGYRNLAELRKRIAPVMLRRGRSTVANQLPERTEKRLDVPMTEMQQQAHDHALSNAQRLARIARRRPLTPTEQNQLMAALQTARMACNAIGLLDGETPGSPKLDELSSLLEQHCQQAGRKMVVFSQWERMTRMAQQAAEKLGLTVVRLHGGVPTASRGELMRRFSDDDSVQVFISTDAGGTGLNLQAASVLVNLDMPWNPAVLDQRIARIHRLGQRRAVYIVNMVACQGYEGRVLQLVQGKRSLFDNVVDPEAAEDVVGVSRKALESILSELDEEPASAAPEEPRVDLSVETPDVSVNAAGAEHEVDDDPVDAPEVSTAISQLRLGFGDRLERVVGSGGGIIGVLTHYQDGDEATAEAISSADLPVTVLDVRGFKSLERLGSASPLRTATDHDQAASRDARTPVARMVQVQETLAAAESLFQSDQYRAAAELIAATLRSNAALRGHLAQPPAAADMTAWLYAEAVPRGWLDNEEATAILKAEGLARSVDLPPPLVEQALNEARGALARSKRLLANG
ncbi:DEAD/DEAH box helicase, partial [Aquisalimonas sp.]|uniref:DEAD/DEAH box helicase n=1 Tax=Aquisalimonas sp. TaxID=1872621 RepID=UPI0025B9BD8C